MASRDPKVDKAGTGVAEGTAPPPETAVEPAVKPRSGQKVFKKTSPNGRITVYVGQRDFLDTGDVVEAVEGVVLVDPVYLNKDGDQKKVFCQLEGAFRYGKEELEVIGINFEKVLFNNIVQVIFRGLFCYVTTFRIEKYTTVNSRYNKIGYKEVFVDPHVSFRVFQITKKG